jgi:predicted DNA repair protein MutK
MAPHDAHAHEAEVEPIAVDARTLEDEKVASAIRTDFILSAEIMAITLGTVSTASVWTQGAVLAIVGLLITVAVYGAVALIVKADDFGVMLAGLASRSPFAALARAFGRGLVKAMPTFLKALGLVGTAAMVWVGGGIVLHGFEEYGLGGPAHALHDAGAWAARAVPAIGGLAAWLVQAAGSGVAGIVLGALLIPLTSHAIAPLWRSIKKRLRRRAV